MCAGSSPKNRKGGFWKRFKGGLAHAFAVERGTEDELSAEEQETLDLISKRVMRMGMAVPAIAFLESMRPLNFIGSQVLLFFIPIPLWVGASILFVIDLIGMAQPGGGTAHDVHLAGALFGFLYIKAGWHLRADLALFDLPSTLAAHRARGRESHRLGEEARLDELLARISKAGLNSLSKSEKEFLKRMSKRP